MRIAFVTPYGPLRDKFLSVVESDFPDLDVECLTYEKFDEVPKLVGDRQEEFDAILFGGHVAMTYANAYQQRKTLWRQLPRAGSTVLCALLNAIRMGWDIMKLSFDSYDEALLLEIYKELGYEVETPLQVFKGNMLDSSYSESAFEFHKNNLRTRKAAGCLTSLNGVHLQLNKEGLPSILLIATRDVLREQLNFVQQFHRAKKGAEGRIVVLWVTMDFPSDYSVMQESDDLFMLERMKIAQQIYRYASHLQATVLEMSLRDYILFSTKEIIEMETDYYRNFKLLDWMEQETFYNVSIGVGYGDTVAGARSAAVAAMLRTRGYNRNSACVCLSDRNFIGPFFGTAADRKEPHIDSKLLAVAESTGISVNTLYKLHCFALGHNAQGTFTSQALADGLELSKRRVDKILQNLEQHGFVKVVGKRVMEKSGRPSRVLAMNLRAE
jgi:hypothetical protein